MRARPCCAVMWPHAELSDVAALGADARAEDQAGHFAGGTVNEDVRDLRGKGSAAGVAHDVVQEAHGAVGGAVLIVDETVRVVGIGLGDEAAGGGQVVLAPRAQLEFTGHGRTSLIVHRRQGLDHEQAAIEGEAGLSKDGGKSAGGMEKELRLDAVHLGRILEGFEEVGQEHALDFARGLGLSIGERGGSFDRMDWLVIDSEDIADDGFALLVNAEGVAGDTAASTAA